MILTKRVSQTTPLVFSSKSSRTIEKCPYTTSLSVDRVLPASPRYANCYWIAINDPQDITILFRLCHNLNIILDFGFIL